MQRYCRDFPQDTACPKVNCLNTADLANNPDYCDVNYCVHYFPPNNTASDSQQAQCDNFCSQAALGDDTLYLNSSRTPVCKNRCQYGGVQGSYLCYQFCQVLGLSET